VRIDEFASAEEQLALWKLVSDNVWSAIAAQAEQERRANAEKAARGKSKRGMRKSSPKVAKPPAPKAPIPAKPAADAGNKAPQSAAAQQPANVTPVQLRGPWGATGIQPRAPIQPTPTVTSGGVATQVQQSPVSQPKPRITARAGGLTL
jgi:hypothetical protein